MKQIYKHKRFRGQLCYKGKVICPTCKKEYELDTTDEAIFDNPPTCFKCKVEGKVKK